MTETARQALATAIADNLVLKPGGNVAAVVAAIFNLIEGRIAVDTANNISVLASESRLGTP